MGNKNLWSRRKVWLKLEPPVVLKNWSRVIWDFIWQRKWIGNYMVNTQTTQTRGSCVQENSALWMKWCQGFCLQCHSDVVYRLFGRDPWRLLAYCTLPVQKLDTCSKWPSQVGLSFPRSCCQWAGQERAALVQLLSTGLTQLFRGFRWDRLESEQGEGWRVFVEDFLLFGVFLVFFFNFYSIWPEVCLFTSHFCNSNGSQMSVKLSGGSLSECQK